MKKYLISQISALSLLSSAVKQDDGWRFYFNATDPSKEYLIALSEQDDCMMFYQAMAVLYGSEDTTSPCDRLSDVLVYIDFSGIFDRKPVGRIAELQHKTEYLFRPEGIEIVLDERYPARRYIAFERSASMSRHNVLSFVREDVYEPLRERMMLGMKIGNCQLSKLYAYNGLMFTGGVRKEITDLLNEKRIIVIDNPKSIVKDTEIITVEDDGTDNPVRKYSRVETKADVEVLEFDGEGIISKELSSMLTESGQHHSFQIRLPYIKGVVHEVDFKKLFSELRVTKIIDIWGNAWDNVSSNLEKLPYYAYMLDKETLKHKANPATDAELFTFAQSPNWQDSLDQHVLERTKAIIAAYHEAMNRNRFIRHIPKERKRQTDIERILFARGQENLYSVDELYSAFDHITPYGIRQARLKLSETIWHLTPLTDRLIATYEIINGVFDASYRELFCDFRHGGYRFLGDIICDLDDMYRAKEIADHVKHQDDSKDLNALLSNTDQTGDYRKTIVSNCINLMTSHIKGAEKLNLNEVLKCAVTLGERQFALEVMPMTVLENCRGIKR